MWSPLMWAGDNVDMAAVPRSLAQGTGSGQAWVSVVIRSSLGWRAEDRWTSESEHCWLRNRGQHRWTQRGRLPSGPEGQMGES